MSPSRYLALALQAPSSVDVLSENPAPSISQVRAMAWPASFGETSTSAALPVPLTSPTR